MAGKSNGPQSCFLKKRLRLLKRCTPLIGALLCVSQVQAAISLTGSAPTYSQDFNSLSSTSWTNDSTLPGWSLFRQPASAPVAITSITLGTGSSNAGAFYSFSTGDGDYALGGVGSGGNYFGSPSSNSIAGWIAVALTNDTGSSIDSFTVKYDGEQWRYGGNTSPQTMVLQYGFGTSFAEVSSWTDAGGAYDFTSPQTTSGSALDGNAAANRTADLGGTISSLSWNSSETLWIRWVERNDSGNDHGLAVDNFSFSATTVGSVTTTGDFDGDGDVDGADFVAWQTNFPLAGGATPTQGDANADGQINGADFAVWQNQFGSESVPGTFAVPEPSSMLLSSVGIAALMSFALRRRNRACTYAL